MAGRAQPGRPGRRLVAKTLALVPVLILVAGYRLGWWTFTTVSRSLAVVPGRLGEWWRAQWYSRTLSACGEGLTVDWMAAFRTPKTRVGKNVYVGTFCWIGWADIGDDVMLGGHVVVLSGGQQHNFDRVDVPMSAQRVELRCVTIGADVWVGNGAIVMADISPGTVVGAGSVIVRTLEPYSVVAGVPARALRSRTGKVAEGQTGSPDEWQSVTG